MIRGNERGTTSVCTLSFGLRCSGSIRRRDGRRVIDVSDRLRIGVAAEELGHLSLPVDPTTFNETTEMSLRILGRRAHGCQGFDCEFMGRRVWSYHVIKFGRKTPRMQAGFRTAICRWVSRENPAPG